MNGSFGEQGDISRKQEQGPSLSESPDEGVAETLLQIKAIESDESDVLSPSAFLEDAARRLGFDDSERESVRREIGFDAKSDEITRERQEVKRVFQERVRRALMPVMAALAFQAGPALSEETQLTERPKELLEASVVVKGESRELTEEEIFDLNSPLAITGEKMKSLKREILPGELLLLKDFHERAWREEYEWAAISGSDSGGEFLLRTSRLGFFGGNIPLDARRNITHNMAVTHTHPVDSYLMEGITSEGIRSGQERAPLMPPSAGDIETCLRETNNDSVGRVVDIRGVWEYRCDKNHPVVEKRLGAESKLQSVLEMTMLSFGVESHDKALVGTALARPDKTPTLESLFLRLDKKYPGIAKQSAQPIAEFVAGEIEYATIRLMYEQKVSNVARTSRDVSDTESSREVRELIEEAERSGVYMSFTPFRETPKDKSRRK